MFGHKVTIRAAIVLFTAVLVGCASPRPVDHLTALQLAAANVKIDLSDGVSEVEAYKIASRYKDRSSEGYVGIPKVEGATWRVAIFETFAGLHARDVLIDKNTGVCHVVSPADVHERVPDKSIPPI